MASRTSDGVGLTTNQTFYAFPPIELGRAGGTVAGVERISGGTGYSASTVATTPDRTGGTGCTLTITVTGGVVNAAATVANGGDGYRLGDVLTLTGGGSNATFRVSRLSYTN